MAILTQTSLRAHRFNIGDYQFVSQDPSVAAPAQLMQLQTMFLPQFLRIWIAIERATGYRWKCTSLIRDSPSHELCQAIDLAPDIAVSARPYYAVTNRSDPVLYKRLPLIHALQTLVDVNFGPWPMGIFIEPDHLHIQILKPSPAVTHRVHVVLWGQPKPIYADTLERMRLPVTSTGY